MKLLNSSKPKIHIFVCINDRSEKKKRDLNCLPSCSPKINRSIVKELKDWILQMGLVKDVYCTKTQCLGFCNSDGGVVVIYPSGKFFTDIQNVKDLKEIVKSELKI